MPIHRHGHAQPPSRVSDRSDEDPCVSRVGRGAKFWRLRAFRLRAPVAEFPNLGLKAKLGLRQLVVRGLEKVRWEVWWACLTYHVQQGFRLRWKVRLQPAPTYASRKG